MFDDWVHVDDVVLVEGLSLLVIEVVLSQAHLNTDAFTERAQ